jgi:hypothetical protein
MTEKKCFVIFPIGQEGSNTRKRSETVFKHIICKALDDYQIIRADHIEKPGQITMQVIENIVEIPLMIADLTDNNANVFYELSLRHALGKPAILIIQEDQISQVPFDLKDMRIIPYKVEDPDRIEKTKEDIANYAKGIEEILSSDNIISRYVKLAPISEPAGPDDIRDNQNPSVPELVMTVAYLQANGDGTTKTMMLTENMNAIHWGYDSNDRANAADKKFHFGFCWEQPEVIASALAGSSSGSDPKQGFQARRINGQNEAFDADDFDSMVPNDGFPSSNHPGGINVAFVGGQTVYVSDQIDNLVYAQLMTSNYKRSDLMDAAGNRFEKELDQPGDDAY